jgi:hypothetical protein
VGSATWTKTTLSQTPGAIASRQFQCVLPQTVNYLQDVNFTDSGIGFGTTLPTSTTPFTNFLLQPGFYQVHFETVIGGATVGSGQTLSFGSFPFAVWNAPTVGNISGDRLFSVTTANTSAALLFSGGTPNDSFVLFAPSCLFILTQLH